jgi:ribosomal protein S18 acetylase RimI-like enzyme
MLGLSLRKIIFCEKSLSKKINTYSLQFSIRECDFEDISNFKDIYPSKKIREFESRLSKNRICMAAFDYNILIAFMWISFSKEQDVHTGAEIPVGTNEAYIYHVFTKPSYRRLGVMTALHWQTFKHLKSRNISSVKGGVDSRNYPSKKMYKKLGLTPVKILYGFNFYGFRKNYWVKARKKHILLY